MRVKLDRRADERQETFDRAVNAARGAFPTFNLNQSPATDQIPVFERYLPLVLHLKTYFEQSKFTHRSEGLVCRGAPQRGWVPFSASPLKAFGRCPHSCRETVLPSPLSGQLEGKSTFREHRELSSDGRESQGHHGRLQALGRETRVIDILQKTHDNIPPEQRTLDDEINLGRAWNDHGSTYLDMEEHGKAEVRIQKALDLYKTLRSEDELRFQYSMQYRDLSYIRVYQGRIAEVLALSKRAHDFCLVELG